MEKAVKHSFNFFQYDALQRQSEIYIYIYIYIFIYMYIFAPVLPHDMHNDSVLAAPLVPCTIVK